MPTRQTLLTGAIRALAMDAVQQANSGHPGMPMGMAEIALALWGRHLSHNPTNPHWANRDRFILSNGHGSMLIYALLHLTGYDLPMSEIKRFRQMHSKTPGHPEFGYTPGVETTTGPLGQGITNAVGFALAEKLLANTFNRPGMAIVDHYTYVFLGDGCLMEGVSHEACSLAGTLGLGKLIALYDDNGISIDGKVPGWFTDNTVQRFEAYGWHVQTVDGHDVDAIDAAIRAAKVHTSQPSMICCKTVIGKGAPNKQGSHKTHGEALGEEEIAATRATIDWPYAPFEVPQEVYDGWNAHAKGAKAESEWNTLFAQYQTAHPDLAAEFLRRMKGDLPAHFNNCVLELIEGAREKAESIATRKASGNALAKLGPQLPELIGGSADLMGSVFTNWPGSQVVQPGVPVAGNIINFGVREFAMAAITNGMVLHGGFIPETGTFLVFSDYSRNAIRMAALMKLRNIFVFTHDSIGVGEDGPTHQPVEQTSSLRLIPNLHVWRPCDTVETAVAWGQMLQRHNGPACLIATRQNCAFQARGDEIVNEIKRGGYVLADSRELPFKAILIATGSEVDLAMRVRAAFAQNGVPIRVVSMPCTQVFDAQDESYRQSVLPSGVPRIAIEAGVSDTWYKYVGLDGAVIGLDRFGESAPFKDLYEYFGFTVAKVYETVQRLIDRTP